MNTALLKIILDSTNFQVKLDNKIQFSSSLSNADYKRLQDEMSLEPKITLVFLNQTDFNPLSNFSNEKSGKKKKGFFISRWP